MTRLTEAEKDAAYERGWKDSLTALFAPLNVTMNERYYYIRGWQACADYRWQYPSNRGRAPDANYREPRK